MYASNTNSFLKDDKRAMKRMLQSTQALQTTVNSHSKALKNPLFSTYLKNIRIRCSHKYYYFINI